MSKSKKRIKSIFKFSNLEGVEYKVYEKKLRGLDGAYCESSEVYTHPKIVLDPTVGDKIRLRLWCEEIYHALFFEESEKKARKLAYTIAKALYKDGYRRIK